MINFQMSKMILYRCDKCKEKYRPRVEIPAYCPRCGIEYRDPTHNYGFTVSNKYGEFEDEVE